MSPVIRRRRHVGCLRRRDGTAGSSAPGNSAAPLPAVQGGCARRTVKSVERGDAAATMVGHVVGPRSHGRGRRHPRRRGRRLHRARRRPGRARGPQRRRQDLAPQGGGGHGRAEGRGDPAPGAVRLPAAGPPARPHPAHPVRPRPRPRRPRPRRARRAPRGAAPQDGGAARGRAARRQVEPRPRRLRARRRLRGRVRGPAAAGRAGAVRRPGRAAHHRALGRRAAAGRAGPHPVRRQRPADARRAHQPPGQRRPRLAARLPARLPGRPHRHQPRPRAARRVDHPGAAPRPPWRGRRRRADRLQGHVLAVQGRPRARRGPAGEDRGPPADRDRPPPDPRRPVGRQGQQGGVRQVVGDPHRAHPVRGRRGADGAAGPPAPPARPAPVGSHRAHRPRPGQELRRRSLGLRRPGLRGRPGRATARAGPQRCGEDEPAAHPRGHVRGQPGHRRLGAPGGRRLLRAGARGHPRPAPRCSTTWTRPRPGNPPRSAGACSACSA